MAKITVLVGIPCSGKSTFCKKFPNSDIISRDAIRLVFGEKTMSTLMKMNVAKWLTGEYKPFSLEEILKIMEGKSTTFVDHHSSETNMK